MLRWCLMVMAVFSIPSAHPFSTRQSEGKCRSIKLWGKGRIKRVGPREDADDIPVWEEEPIVEEEPPVVIPSMSLQDLLLPPQDCDVDQMGPTAMAYIGDVVFELFVRSRHVWPTRKTADLQQQVVTLVRAEHQSKLLALLLETFPLTKKEESIITRGRNTASSTRSRQNPKAYQDATALEALIGYLYISDRTRCEELLNWLHIHLKDPSILSS